MAALLCLRCFLFSLWVCPCSSALSSFFSFALVSFCSFALFPAQMQRRPVLLARRGRCCNPLKRIPRRCCTAIYVLYIRLPRGPAPYVLCFQRTVLRFTDRSCLPRVPIRVPHSARCSMLAHTAAASHHAMLIIINANSSRPLESQPVSRWAALPFLLASFLLSASGPFAGACCTCPALNLY